MKIAPHDLVLEIGSGDNPKPRSDVLCDKIPEDDTQRGGSIALDRPFVAADGQYLPFADKSFDYIICCHVLEHAEDPALFLSELMRVGKGGYIETPTEMGERLYGWPYHKWLINLDLSGKLVFRKKVEEGVFGQIFHYLFREDHIYAKFHARYHNLFLIEYEWSGKIDHEIVESGASLLDLDDPEVVGRLLETRTKPGISALVKGLLPSGVRRWAKSSLVKSSGRYRKTLKDIEDIIVCPSCKGQLQWHDDLISCQICDRTYPIKDGIPFLLVDQND